MKQNFFYSPISFFLIGVSLLFHGCVTDRSPARGSLVTTSELDSLENNRKLDKLGKSIGGLSKTIKGFQTDIRYLREEIDDLKSRVRKLDGGVTPSKKKNQFQEGDIVASTPPSLEQTRESQSVGQGKEISKDSGIKVASLRPEDYYQDAYDDVRFGEYKSAIENFRVFIDRYPNHSLADNAQYWIAECYYGLKDYKNAEKAFRKVQERYPKGNKVPDARLKHALCLYDLKKFDASFSELENLSLAYQGSRIGRIAADQLQKLKKKRKK